MRPFKQGKYSRLCSVYSTINSISLMGVKLSNDEWQSLYDHIISQMIKYKHIEDVLLYGADARVLEAIFVYADDYLRENKKIGINYHRPFWNNRLSLDELIAYIQEQQSKQKTVLLRVKSNTFDHYSIFDRIDKTSIKFFDSDSMPSLNIEQVATDQSNKHQIMLRQVYVLEIVECIK